MSVYWRREGRRRRIFPGKGGKQWTGPQYSVDQRQGKGNRGSEGQEEEREKEGEVRGSLKQEKR